MAPTPPTGELTVEQYLDWAKQAGSISPDVIEEARALEERAKELKAKDQNLEPRREAILNMGGVAVKSFSAPWENMLLAAAQTYLRGQE